MNLAELQTLIRECVSQIRALCEQKLALYEECRAVDVKIKKAEELRNAFMNDLMSAVCQAPVECHVFARAKEK